MGFKFVPADERQIALMDELRRDFQNLSDKINSRVGPCRGVSLCQTKLEEANMWLNKGITFNDNALG